MIILGVNAYHGDSSACLVIDGKLICAIEEERIRRIKHWAGFPSESIKWCLDYAGCKIGDVDHIAISRDPMARLVNKLCRVFLKRPDVQFLKARLANYGKVTDIKSALAEFLGVRESDIRAKVVNVEHHRAHLASSFFVSPFQKAALASVDGFGDFVSAMTGTGNGTKIRVLNEARFPHSLGIFYTAVTQYMGFRNYGDEYKVMGLSAIGKPSFLDKMRKIVKLRRNGLFELDTSYFLHDDKGIELTWMNDAPKIGRLFSDKLIALLGEPRRDGEDLDQRFQDVAASVQAMYEEAFFHILNHLHDKTGLENLALSGGCIQNSLANGKILEKTAFKEVYIPPAAHDGGGAIGAAFYLYNQVLGLPRVFVMDSPYWGPCYGNDEIRKALDANHMKYEELPEDELFRRTAAHIASGRIVGWFQGRSEWGPRALGNRSILVDPRRHDMKDILNARIKKREWFRPFAPSILEEKVGEWFEDAGPVPFMEKVYYIRQEKRELIPAVTHIDGTGRLQTVSCKTNPRYHALISEFGKATGVPIVLNTSFNENEPIVNTPQDAVECFLRTNMDVLVLGNYFCVKA